MSSKKEEIILNKKENVPAEEGADILRPVEWDDYIGQDKVKANVRLMVRAARQRNEPCDHILLHGQAGLGKTTLVYIIGREMGTQVKSVTGPALEKVGDVAAILSNLNEGDILFIDEIHRMGKAAEEVLYPALENRKLHLVVGKGPSARTVSIGLPPFTLVGATTKSNMLSAPLRSRFGAMLRFEYYTIPDIQKIIERSARMLEVRISPEAVEGLACASRFTPRTANRLLRRARDFAQVHGDGRVTGETIEKTLAMLEIDGRGLDATDRELLRTIIVRFGGGPVGVQALAASLHEEAETIEDVYEPYLVGAGFLNRTRLGRVITADGRKHLGFSLDGML